MTFTFNTSTPFRSETYRNKRQYNRKYNLFVLVGYNYFADVLSIEDFQGYYFFYFHQYGQFQVFQLDISLSLSGIGINVKASNR